MRQPSFITCDNFDLVTENRPTRNLPLFVCFDFRYLRTLPYVHEIMGIFGKVGYLVVTSVCDVIDCVSYLKCVKMKTIHA